MNAKCSTIGHADYVKLVHLFESCQSPELAKKEIFLPKKLFEILEEDRGIKITNDRPIITYLNYYNKVCSGKNRNKMSHLNPKKKKRK